MMLEVKDLSKTYHGRTVLRDVSFCLPAGTCIGVCGDNGSGKSTLLRLLAQAESPDRGQILFDGKNVLGDRRFVRQSIGYVPQSDALLPELTVERQLKLWQSACGISGSLPEDVLHLLGLEELLKVRTRELSGGMRRRVSIAMALVTKPKILIMDEVTSGLDGGYCEKLTQWIAEFLQNGGRAVWCTHHEQELQQLCGSCIRLADGIRQK